MIEDTETTQNTDDSSTPEVAPAPPPAQGRRGRGRLSRGRLRLPRRPTGRGLARPAPDLSVGYRRVLALSTLAGLLIFVSLFLPWYTYEGFGNKFTAKGWKVFSSIDVVLALAGLGAALMALATLQGRLLPSRALTAILAESLVVIGLVVYRVIERPYTENYEVTPHAGLILAGVCGLAIALATAFVLLRAGGAAAWLAKASDWMATPGSKSPPRDEP